ncbi:MAG: ABC transporter ATP-binding protein [Promethearchaeota archaeon]
MNKNIIETFNLTKKYSLKKIKKEIIALNNVNLNIKKGEIFSILGSNGAGKSTLIKILTTLIRPTGGYALINGYNILKDQRKVKENIALMLEKNMLYYRITGYDNLKFFCQLYNIDDYKRKIFELAEEFELKNWLNNYVETYSSGMKMKLALIRTLLLNREILFLDEPTTGIDIYTKLFIIEKLKKINNTIFLASHDMFVVEKLADKIAFINNGEIIRVGTNRELKDAISSNVPIEVYIKQEKKELKKELKKENFVLNIIENKNKLIISINNRRFYQNFLKIACKYPILKINEPDTALEDVFKKIV